MQQILSFDEMLTPKIIIGIYWLALAFAVLAAVISLFSGHILAAIGILILGPLLVRVYCELLIVVFKINEALQDIRKK